MIFVIGKRRKKEDEEDDEVENLKSPTAVVGSYVGRGCQTGTKEQLTDDGKWTSVGKETRTRGRRGDDSREVLIK